MKDTRVGTMWLLLLVLWPSMSPAASLDAPCAAHFRRGAYTDAAVCFARHIPARLSGLTKLQQVVVGRRIRNAAFSYRRAALATPALGKSSYYKEQAIGLLQRYLKHRLYESKHRKTSAIVLLHELQEKLFYAPLTVMAMQKRARVSVVGFQFRVDAVQRWSGHVRPGTYQITVDDGKRRQKLVVSVTTRRPIFLTVRETKAPRPRPRPMRRLAPRRRISPAAWWLLGIGGAVLAGAAITLGLSQQERGRMERLIDDGPKDNRHTADINEAKHSANRLLATSSICWALGGGLAIGGVIVLLLPTTSKAVPVASPPSTAQTLQTFTTTIW